MSVVADSEVEDDLLVVLDGHRQNTDYRPWIQFVRITTPQTDLDSLHTPRWMKGA